MSQILDFCIAAWAREDAFHIEDAYKWLYHATLGGEHAIADEQHVRRWMDREWSALGPPRPNEPMTVSLRPDGRLLRLNLRPFKAAGGSKEDALAGFIESARSFHADRQEFLVEWRELGARLEGGPIGGLTLEEWKRLDSAARPDYPAIHHSQGHEIACEPAYRVLEHFNCNSILIGP
jgi:hypothetical protein